MLCLKIYCSNDVYGIQKWRWRYFLLITSSLFSFFYSRSSQQFQRNIYSSSVLIAVDFAMYVNSFERQDLSYFRNQRHSIRHEDSFIRELLSICFFFSITEGPKKAGALLHRTLCKRLATGLLFINR